MYGNLCLFAHFDPDDILADYVIFYLKAIRAAGFPIVVISTSKLSKGDCARLLEIADDVILRENSGHDFASWNLGIQRYADRVTGRLLIANDSVYGPIGDLNAAIGRMTSVSADAYGMIESLEIARHLQSWFLLLEKQVHQHPAFRAVFARDFASLAKQDIVREGEVGLSQALLQNNFRLHALFSGLSQTGRAMRFTSNYSHFLWRELIEREGIPFLKIELLRVNPCRIPNLSDCFDVVRRRAPDLVPMIQEHLARRVPNGEAGILALHTLPIRRDDIQSFIRRDYDFAAGRRPLASLGNVAWLWWLRAKGILRHLAYRLLRSFLGRLAYRLLRPVLGPLFRRIRLMRQTQNGKRSEP